MSDQVDVETVVELRFDHLPIYESTSPPVPRTAHRNSDRQYQRVTIHQFSAEIVNELAPLAQSDNWHSLFAVGCDFLIVALAVWAGQTTPWAYPLAVLVIGSRQRGLTTILHDAAHNRAAKHSTLNRIAGSYLSGYLIFQTFRTYRQSHVLHHHGHFTDAEADPDYQLYLQSGLYDGMTRGQFLWRQVLATLLMLNALGYLWYVVKHRLGSFRRSKAEMIGLTSYWAAIAFIVHWFNAWHLFLLYWIVPYMTAFLIIGRFIEIAEHYPLVGVNQDKSDLYQTRNRFSAPLEACLCSIHGENYHLVHHLRPDIPFWNMSKAHRAMLRDPLYKEVNDTFGGIFFSSNGRPALFPALVSGVIALPSVERSRSA